VCVCVHVFTVHCYRVDLSFCYGTIVACRRGPPKSVSYCVWSSTHASHNCCSSNKTAARQLVPR